MKLLKKFIDFFGYWLVGRQFIAGRTRKEMFARARKLQAQGFEITINLLGEHYRDRALVEKTVQEYIAVINEIPKELGRGSVAVKPSQIGVEISQEYCRQNLRIILEHAHKNNVGLEIDIENSKYATSTYILFRYFSNQSPYHNLIRLAVQVNNPDMAQHYYSFSLFRHNIRLVKGGAYTGEAIVDEDIIRQRFIDIAKDFLKERIFQSDEPLYLATVRDRKLVKLIKAEMPDNRNLNPSWKFQMLYGPWRSLQNNLLAQGYPVVMYLPYGEEWIAYGIRRWRFILKTLKQTIRPH